MIDLWYIDYHLTDLSLDRFNALFLVFIFISQLIEALKKYFECSSNGTPFSVFYCILLFIVINCVYC